MAIKVTISGTEYVCTSGYRIVQQAGAISSAELAVRLDEHEVPQSLESVVITIDDVPIFWGFIKNVESPKWSSTFETEVYPISVQSAEVILSWRLVSDTWEGKYTHEIVQDIFDDYLVEEGLTLGEISITERLYETYTANYTKVSDILDEFVKDLGGSYWISPDKKFYFCTKESFEIVTPPEHITKLKQSDSYADLRTKQIVTGATSDTSTQTRSCYWVSGQMEIPVSYPLSEEPGVTINGVIASVGSQGVDEDDTSVSFLWRKSGMSITVNPGATTKPAVGDLVVAVYIGTYDVLVEEVNDTLRAEIAELTGLSGKIEKVQTDTTIDNAVDAQSLADTLLARYDEREKTLSCVCHDLATSALNMLWPLSYPNQHIEGNYVITERTIEGFGPDAYRISLKLKNKGFFSKYGSVFKNTSKTKTGTSAVFKGASVYDKAGASEEYECSIQLPYYPVATGSPDIVEPMLDGFYPV